tara:strand:+ start:8099 stop:8695 length:597 start_codon:yes stop_codon:yes gene_type:complete
MDKIEREFIINNGLLLGLIFIFFPVLDLMIGLKISLLNYFLIFVIGWILFYTLLIIKLGRQFASQYDIFPFRNTFRLIFLISAIALGILSLGKTIIWTYSFPEKYIDINKNREIALVSFPKNVLDDANLDGNISDEDYKLQIENLDNSILLIQEKWELINEEGIGNTYFFQILITSLFFISIYCAILSLFIRKVTITN